MAIIDTAKQTPEEIAKVLWDEGLLDMVRSVEAETSEITTVKDVSNRPVQWTEETKDLNGTVLSKRVNTYTYHITGEVDVINQKTYRGEAELRHEQDVVHSTDANTKPVANVFLAYVRNKYQALVTEPTGQIVPLGNVTILPEKAFVSTIDSKTFDATGIQAITAVTYREENVYDEEGNVIDTKTITIPGNPIFITFNIDGTYVMSGEPIEQVAIIYYGELKIEAV